MIGVDTNVLLRSLVHDDPVQGRRVTLLAERIARAEDNLFVDDVVLCETVWTLRTGFRLSRERIAEVLEDLIETALDDVPRDTGSRVGLAKNDVIARFRRFILHVARDRGVVRKVGFESQFAAFGHGIASVHA